MGDETICKCSKEVEIKGIHKDVNTLMRLVVEGNGKEPMIVTLPRLADIADKLNTTVDQLATGIRGLLKFQTTWEARMDERMKADELLSRKKRTYQWAIGILIGFSSTLLGLLIGVTL